ncbi:MAG: hypothetical protein FWB86_07410, partial [Treponema sp.]|nr:hypothetical protein [Treponema sp.]MCL2252120.1 hypothetical protein [Treponema sp.]
PPPPDIYFRHLVIFFSFFIVFSSPSGAQEWYVSNKWYDGFFFEGSVHNYFPPSLLEDYVKPEIGFRGALGFELNNFRFAAESGFSRITGTNPLVLEITLVPLVLKFGYHWNFFSILGLQGDLHLGVAFSNTSRYETALDAVQNNLSKDSENSFLSGIRLYLTISPLKFLRIYAGGGIDAVFEKKGTLLLPVLEIGISVKPFLISKYIKSKINSRFLVNANVNGVYFERNSVTAGEEYIQILDDAGFKLKENPARRITLRAYSAPYGVELQVRHGSGEPALSASRVQWCAEYLWQNYEIDTSRIRIEYRDAGDREELYRCVEVIVR